MFQMVSVWDSKPVIFSTPKSAPLQADLDFCQVCTYEFKHLELQSCFHVLMMFFLKSAQGHHEEFIGKVLVPVEPMHLRPSTHFNQKL